MQSITLPRSMPLANVRATTASLKLSDALAKRAQSLHSAGRTALGCVYDARARAALANAVQAMPTDGN